MYIVKVVIPFGYDDTLDCEYSGIEYQAKEDAEKELKEAKQDTTIIYAYIEER